MTSRAWFRTLMMCAALAAMSAPARPSGSSPPPRETPASGGSTEQTEASLFDKGMDLVKSEEWLEARKIFTQLEAQDPKNPEVLNMLAYTQRKTGELDEALANYKRALDIKPKFPQAREYMAEAYLQAALRETETLRGYGGSGEEELAKLVHAFQEAAATAGGQGVAGGGKGGKKSNW